MDVKVYALVTLVGMIAILSNMHDVRGIAARLFSRDAHRLSKSA